ncbi:uncharacterized protein LY89DRAFT_723264 [Mollisia scopiformis]|uniref:Hydrophobin n=1 Tax=Mollisia scopiformis TaxID=149040 RepID=A0A194WRN1_MOLSC|nr:uncharacterized protein LY89DRAFT_723264 [Mollisia scopiformis]KUJ10661.1 hypothetical protein LY89DRAFT_723264 [Mollisia scopiformis]
MQFTKALAILSLAATGLAAPTVEVAKRTNGISCAQSQGTLACCQQKPVLQPVSSLGANIAPTLGGILGVIPDILPLIVPTVSVAAQCVAIIAEVEACATPNICCLSSSSGNTNSAGLIQLLSNDDISVCPGVTV